MEPIIKILEAVGVFVVGLLARAGLVLAVLAVLLLPIILMAMVLRAAEEMKRRQLGIRDVAGLLFRPDLWYTPGHTWLARRRGGSLAIGVDDLALRLLPAVTGVEAPMAGTRVERGQPLFTLHAGARSITIPAPVAGTVSAVNRAVLREPELVKREGYGRGWLVAVAPADETFAGLPRGDEAERFMRTESARWSAFFEERLGFAAADGGHLVAPAPALLGEQGWRELVAAFVGARQG
jgi:glycine cleavage system H protein